MTTAELTAFWPRLYGIIHIVIAFINIIISISISSMMAAMKESVFSAKFFETARKKDLAARARSYISFMRK